MSEEIAKKLCELLNQLIQQNSVTIWEILSAIGTCVTPLLAVVISYFLGKKIEKQKEIVSQANTATLEMMKNQPSLSEDDIFLYIKACITASTENVANYFELSIEEAFVNLNKLKKENKIKSFENDEDKGKWKWQIV